MNSGYAVIILLYTSYSGFAFIPQITDQIETAVVQEKGTAYLNCTAVIDDNQESQISWYRTLDKQQIASGTTLKEPVRRGPHGVSKYAVRFLPGRPSYAPNLAGVDLTKLRTYQLIVRFVDINDANTMFRCVIELRTTPIAEWPTAYGRILVKRAPEILPGLTSQIVNEGESLTLVCVAQGSPTPKISWTRANGRPLSIPGSPQTIYVSCKYGLAQIFNSKYVYLLIPVNYSTCFKPDHGQLLDFNQYQ
ncbi:hypothetical protein AHF37_10906 [Paragonimus kellicotti]|nr:hypothetical protein AHF37_10906 [Paragonimus kellicotti]